MDDTDNEGSRSIPSRTRIGKQAAFIEKFPAFGQPLTLLRGLITIPFWGYKNLSMAMADIMLSDLPRIEYRKEKLTKSDIDSAIERTKVLQERIKKNGLGVSLKNVVNTNDYIKKTGGK